VVVLVVDPPVALMVIVLLLTGVLLEVSIVNTEAHSGVQELGEKVDVAPVGRFSAEKETESADPEVKEAVIVV
jgi:hypothetical protein